MKKSFHTIIVYIVDNIKKKIIGKEKTILYERNTHLLGSRQYKIDK